ncbi:hypothetical protein Tco_1038637 [Tanacetum coccineum]
MGHLLPFSDSLLNITTLMILSHPTVVPPSFIASPRPTRRPRHDDPYVMVRDAATRDEGDDTATTSDPQPLHPPGSPHYHLIMLPRAMTQAAIEKLVFDRVAAALAQDHATRGNTKAKVGYHLLVNVHTRVSRNVIPLVSTAMKVLLSYAVGSRKQRVFSASANVQRETRPVVLNEAVRMAHTLMEQKLQAKAERIAESNKRK